jgi:hypothetical protein
MSSILDFGMRILDFGKKSGRWNAADYVLHHKGTKDAKRRKEASLENLGVLCAFAVHCQEG